MNRLLIPLMPSAIIGAVASGTGFKAPDAVLIAIAVWAIFVVFRSLMTVASTIVAVCVLGALSQVNWYGAPTGTAYAAPSPVEASPGTFTHLARSVVRAVEDGVGIPHAPPSEARPLVAPPPLPGSDAIQVAAAPASVAAPLPVPAATEAFSPSSPVLPTSMPTGSPAALMPLLPVRNVVATSALAAPQLMTFLGQPRVIDGATLSIDGHLIKLSGISTPDAATNCWRNGHPAACAAMATERLSQLIGTARVTCRGPVQGAAVYAQCSTMMIDDLSKTMLDEGWAVMSRDASPSYQLVANAARGNRRGFWQANFGRGEELEPVIRGVRR